MAKTFAVYAFVTPSNKCYIGSSKRVNRRKYEHENHLRLGIHVNKALQRAWNKYKSEVKHVVLEECYSAKQMLEREQWWIDNHAFFWRGTYNNNLTVTAVCDRTGYKASESTRQKMREARKGRKHSPETIAKMKEKAKARGIPRVVIDARIKANRIRKELKVSKFGIEHREKLKQSWTDLRKISDHMSRLDWIMDGLWKPQQVRML